MTKWIVTEPVEKPSTLVWRHIFQRRVKQPQDNVTPSEIDSPEYLSKLKDIVPALQDKYLGPYLPCSNVSESELFFEPVHKSGNFN